MRFWLIPPLAFLSFGFTPQSFVWQLHQASGHLTGIGRVAAHPNQSHIVFFVSSGGLYKADLQAQQSSLLFTFPESDAVVYDLIVSSQKVYAATSSGVYAVSENGGGELIFQASEEQRPCRSLAALNGTIFVGTSRGVKYRKPDSGVWHVLAGFFQNQPVACLRAEHPFLYIAADQTIVRYDAQTQTFQDILSAPSGSSIGDPIDFDLEGIPYDIESREAFLGFDIDGPHAILALNDFSAWSSDDNGSHWQLLPSGTIPLDIQSVRVIRLRGQRHLAAATNQGMFYLSYGQWIPVRGGMETLKVNDVVQTSGGDIVAATDRGIFILLRSTDGGASQEYSSKQNNSFEAEEKSLISSAEENILAEQKAFSDGKHEQDGGTSGKIPGLNDEPAIRDVQAMAIDYAEVHPDKISDWRKQARRRAILPDFSVGLDRDASELLHWDTGPNPDQLTYGKELTNWDVSLSWDLGDLIWSSDQTSIDSRSKLMVELREEILNQVTRVYFERKRLQVQLAQLDDETLEMETDLRIQELTALLDGFTGGRFSAGILAGKQ